MTLPLPDEAEWRGKPELDPALAVAERALSGGESSE